MAMGYRYVLMGQIEFLYEQTGRMSGFQNNYNCHKGESTLRSFRSLVQITVMLLRYVTPYWDIKFKEICSILFPLIP